METEDNRFEKPLRNAIVKFRAETAEGRAKVYAAARASLGRVQNGRPGDAEALEAAIARIEASFAEPPRARNLRVPRIVTIPAAAFLVGVVSGATAAAYWPSEPVQDASGPAQQLEQFYNRGLPHLPEATAYLHQVVDSIIDRQKRDRSAFTVSAKTFIPLAKFDATLAGQIPKSLPVGSAVVIRADAYNFKVLMNWTLCGVASVASPAMVDKVRAPNPSVGCPYFGLWSAGAANW